MSTTQAITPTKTHTEAAGEDTSTPGGSNGSEFRALLLSRRLQLLNRLQKDAAAAEDIPSLRDGRELKEVERALARIADASFGRCADHLGVPNA